MTKSTTTDADRPLTEAELASIRATLAARKERQAKAEASRKRRLRRLSLWPVPVHGFDRGGGLHTEGGRKLSARQEALQASVDEAIAALLNEGAPVSPSRPLSTTPFETLKAEAKAEILDGKVVRDTDAERMYAATQPRARMVRERNAPEVIPGTEHLDAKQRATLADMRRRVREAEAVLAAYMREGAPPRTIATAEQWVASRNARLDSTMRQFGVTTAIPTEQ